MTSLSALHKYSQEAFEHLWNRLNNKDFDRPYIEKKECINAVTGILWDITQGDEELHDIIKEMDKIDNISDPKERTRLDKMTETWLISAYYERLKNGYQVSINYYLSFIKSILKPQSEEGENKLNISGRKLFQKHTNALKQKLFSMSKTEKLDELKSKYPQYDIESAYTYALLSKKFNLKGDDIKEFDRIISLLTKKPPKKQ